MRTSLEKRMTISKRTGPSRLTTFTHASAISKKLIPRGSTAVMSMGNGINIVLTARRAKLAAGLMTMLQKTALSSAKC